MAEQGLQVFRVLCDLCHATTTSLVGETIEEARALAIKEGFKRIDLKERPLDLCAKCALAVVTHLDTSEKP